MPGTQASKVPEGLRDLMKSLTKEVLREKPLDLYEFAAQFFEKIIQDKKDFKVKEFEPISEYDFLKNRERNSFPATLIYSIIPAGLTELIKDFIKAVLRQRPENICIFGVEYFRNLQKLKKNQTNHNEYVAFENYFKAKEKFVFTPYVKCKCGRTLGMTSSFDGEENHNNCIGYNNQFEENHKNLLDKEELMRVKEKSELKFDEKTIKAVYIIQKFCRRYISKKKLTRIPIQNGRDGIQEKAEKLQLKENVEKGKGKQQSLISESKEISKLNDVTIEHTESNGNLTSQSSSDKKYADHKIETKSEALKDTALKSLATVQKTETSVKEIVQREESSAAEIVQKEETAINIDSNHAAYENNERKAQKTEIINENQANTKENFNKESHESQIVEVSNTEKANLSQNKKVSEVDQEEINDSFKNEAENLHKDENENIKMEAENSLKEKIEQKINKTFSVEEKPLSALKTNKSLEIISNDDKTTIIPNISNQISVDKDINKELSGNRTELSAKSTKNNLETKNPEPNKSRITKETTQEVESQSNENISKSIDNKSTDLEKDIIKSTSQEIDELSAESPKDNLEIKNLEPYKIPTTKQTTEEVESQSNEHISKTSVDKTTDPERDIIKNASEEKESKVSKRETKVDLSELEISKLIKNKESLGDSEPNNKIASNNEQTVSQTKIHTENEELAEKSIKNQISENENSIHSVTKVQSKAEKSGKNIVLSEDSSSLEATESSKNDQNSGNIINQVVKTVQIVTNLIENTNEKNSKSEESLKEDIDNKDKGEIARNLKFEEIKTENENENQKETEDPKKNTIETKSIDLESNSKSAKQEFDNKEKDETTKDFQVEASKTEKNNENHKETEKEDEKNQDNFELAVDESNESSKFVELKSDKLNESKDNVSKDAHEPNEIIKSNTTIAENKMNSKEDIIKNNETKNEQRIDTSNILQTPTVIEKEELHETEIPPTQEIASKQTVANESLSNIEAQINDSINAIDPSLNKELRSKRSVEEANTKNTSSSLPSENIDSELKDEIQVQKSVAVKKHPPRRSIEEASREYISSLLLTENNNENIKDNTQEFQEIAKPSTDKNESVLVLTAIKAITENVVKSDDEILKSTEKTQFKDTSKKNDSTSLTKEKDENLNEDIEDETNVEATKTDILSDTSKTVSTEEKTENLENSKSVQLEADELAKAEKTFSKDITSTKTDQPNEIIKSTDEILESTEKTQFTDMSKKSNSDKDIQNDEKVEAAQTDLQKNNTSAGLTSSTFSEEKTETEHQENSKLVQLETEKFIEAEKNFVEIIKSPDEILGTTKQTQLTETSKKNDSDKDIQNDENLNKGIEDENNVETAQSGLLKENSNDDLAHTTSSDEKEETESLENSKLVQFETEKFIEAEKIFSKDTKSGNIPIAENESSTKKDKQQTVEFDKESLISDKPIISDLENFNKTDVPLSQDSYPKDQIDAKILQTPLAKENVNGENKESFHQTTSNDIVENLQNTEKEIEKMTDDSQTLPPHNVDNSNSLKGILSNAVTVAKNVLTMTSSKPSNDNLASKTQNEESVVVSTDNLGLLETKNNENSNETNVIKSDIKDQEEETTSSTAKNKESPQKITKDENENTISLTLSNNEDIEAQSLEEFSNDTEKTTESLLTRVVSKDILESNIKSEEKDEQDEKEEFKNKNSEALDHEHNVNSNTSEETEVGSAELLETNTKIEEKDKLLTLKTESNESSENITDHHIIDTVGKVSEDDTKLLVSSTNNTDNQNKTLEDISKTVTSITKDSKKAEAISAQSEEKTSPKKVTENQAEEIVSSINNKDIKTTNTLEDITKNIVFKNDNSNTQIEEKDKSATLTINNNEISKKLREDQSKITVSPTNSGDIQSNIIEDISTKNDSISSEENKPQSKEESQLLEESHKKILEDQTAMIVSLIDNKDNQNNSLDDILKNVVPTKDDSMESGENSSQNKTKEGTEKITEDQAKETVTSTNNKDIKNEKTEGIFEKAIQIKAESLDGSLSKSTPVAEKDNLTNLTNKNDDSPKKINENETKVKVSKSLPSAQSKSSENPVPLIKGDQKGNQENLSTEDNSDDITENQKIQDSAPLSIKNENSTAEIQTKIQTLIVNAQNSNSGETTTENLTAPVNEDLEDQSKIEISQTPDVVENTDIVASKKNSAISESKNIQNEDVAPVEFQEPDNKDLTTAPSRDSARDALILNMESKEASIIDKQNSLEKQNEEIVIGKQSAPKVNEYTNKAEGETISKILLDTNKPINQNEKTTTINKENKMPNKKEVSTKVHQNTQNEKLKSKETKKDGIKQNEKGKLISNVEKEPAQNVQDVKTQNAELTKPTRLCQVEGIKSNSPERKYIQYPIAEIYLKSFRDPVEQNLNKIDEILTNTTNQKSIISSTSSDISHQGNETEFSDSLNDEHFERDSLEVNSPRETDIEEDSFEIEHNHNKNIEINEIHKHNLLTAERMPTYLYGLPTTEEQTVSKEKQAKIQKSIVMFIPFENPKKEKTKNQTKFTDNNIKNSYTEKTNDPVETNVSKEETEDPAEEMSNNNVDDDSSPQEEGRLHTIFEQNEYESPRQEEFVKIIDEKKSSEQFEAINEISEKESTNKLNENYKESNEIKNNDLENQIEKVLDNSENILTQTQPSTIILDDLITKIHFKDEHIDEPLDSYDTMSTLSDNDLSESSTFTNSKEFDETVLSDENYNVMKNVISKSKDQKLSESADNTPKGGIYEIDPNNLSLLLQNQQRKEDLLEYENKTETGNEDTVLKSAQQSVDDQIKESIAEVTETVARAHGAENIKEKDTIQKIHDTIVNEIKSETESLTQVLKDLKKDIGDKEEIIDTKFVSEQTSSQDASPNNLKPETRLEEHESLKKPDISKDTEKENETINVKDSEIEKQLYSQNIDERDSKKSASKLENNGTTSTETEVNSLTAVLKKVKQPNDDLASLSNSESNQTQNNESTEIGYIASPKHMKNAEDNLTKKTEIELDNIIKETEALVKSTIKSDIKSNEILEAEESLQKMQIHELKKENSTQFKIDEENHDINRKINLETEPNENDSESNLKTEDLMTAKLEEINVIEVLKAAPTPPHDSPNSTVDLNENFNKLNNAALKIQKAFKNYKANKMSKLEKDTTTNQLTVSNETHPSVIEDNKVNWFVGEEPIISKKITPQQFQSEKIGTLVKHQDQNFEQAPQINSIETNDVIVNSIKNIQSPNELSSQEKIVSAAANAVSIEADAVEENNETLGDSNEEKLKSTDSNAKAEAKSVSIESKSQEDNKKSEEELKEIEMKVTKDDELKNADDKPKEVSEADSLEHKIGTLGENNETISDTAEDKLKNTKENENDSKEHLKDAPIEEVIKKDALSETQHILDAQRRFGELQKSDDTKQALADKPTNEFCKIELTKSFLITEIEYSTEYKEVVEEECIKKSVSQTELNKIEIETETEEDTKAKSSDEETKDIVVEQILQKPVELIEKMQRRRSIEIDASPISSGGKSFEQASFDDPVIKTLESIVGSRNSSAEDTDEVVIMSTENINQSTKSYLKKTHTIASEDPRSLFKSVTIDETIKYIEITTEESETVTTSVESFCLDEDTSENIRKKMMAYSLSEADSDQYNSKDAAYGLSFDGPHDDFNINTALKKAETTSTDTESTIISAATKIQAGARGFLTRRRLRRTSIGSKSTFNDGTLESFGNNAINESLETMIEDEAAKKIQKAYRNHRQNQFQSIERSTKNYSHESSLAAKRMTLQRGDALRINSSPEEDNGNNDNFKTANIKTGTAVTNSKESKHKADQSMKGKTSRDFKSNELKWLTLRQNSMPVQIDSEVFRVIPKHMRKKTNSAEGSKKRGRRVQYD